MIRKELNKNLDSQSFLEFGSFVPDSKDKKRYDLRTGIQAYDWFMHARYSNDIYAYKKMENSLAKNDFLQVSDIYNNHIHHKDDFSFNISKLAALSLFDNPNFFEIGQTLFGCIDGISFCQKLLNKKTKKDFFVNLKEVDWYGFDISDFFNILAKEMHKEYQIITSSNMVDIPSDISVFFAKGITLLYAIKSPQDFFSLINKASFGIFDYSLSLDKDRELNIATGKKVKYLGYQNFLKAYKKEKHKIYLRHTSHIIEESNKIYIEGIFGDEAYCNRFFDVEKSLRNTINVNYPLIDDNLWHNIDSEYLEWSPIEVFLDKLV